MIIEAISSDFCDAASIIIRGETLLKAFVFGFSVVLTFLQVNVKNQQIQHSLIAESLPSVSRIKKNQRLSTLTITDYDI